jgi:hydrogenase small subunit
MIGALFKTGVERILHMQLSRRAFLKYCGAGAATIGLSTSDLGLLHAALASTGAPEVIWIKGSSCDGCSISLLNRIAESAPATVADVLLNNINLTFHTNLMTFAGESAVAVMEQAYAKGNYILVVEGGIPTAFGGHACISYSYKGQEVTFQECVLKYAERASHIICAGTCAAWGGIPASGTNPTQVVGVKALTGRTTVNISGCPANPDWVVWAIVQLILGHSIDLDIDNRPVALYAADLNGDPAPASIHDKCPRNGNDEATAFGNIGDKCLVRLGCRGPDTKARCRDCWNGIAGQGHWCIGVNAPCHGCTERTFPGPEPFYDQYSTF